MQSGGQRGLEKQAGPQEIVLWPPVSTSACLTPSRGAHGKTVQDLFVQQHSNSLAREKMLDELKTLSNIDMAQAAADYMAPDDSGVAGPAAGAASAPAVAAAAAGNEESSLSELAHLASMAMWLAGLQHETVLPGKEAVRFAGHKRSRKDVDTELSTKSVDNELEEVSVDEVGDSNGLLVQQIEEFYHDMTNQTTKHRNSFKAVMKKYSKKFNVSITSLRNIMSFKNRRGDSHLFWNDDLWQLYNETVRCQSCRSSGGRGGRVLCQHYGRGRPSSDSVQMHAVVDRCGNSVAVAPTPKQDPAVAPTPKQGKGRKRTYLVQISLAQVWACLGCSDSKKYLLSKTKSALGSGQQAESE